MDRADVQSEDEEGIIERSRWFPCFSRRSRLIGKRVAIAAAVVTFAPVIIPPIFMISTFALALSFPFGIYLAGYAFTDKIMCALLGFEDYQGDEMVLELDSLVGGSEGRSVSEIESWSGSEKPPLEYGAEDDKEETNLGNKLAVEKELAKSMVLKNDTAAVENEVMGLQKENEVTDEIADSESNIFVKRPSAVFCMVPIEKNSYKECELPDLNMKHLSISEFRRNGTASSLSVMKGLLEENGEDEMKSRVYSGAVSEEEMISEEKHSSEADSFKSKAVVDVQKTYNEEQLWDHVFSMRTIVGCKSALQPSLWEELMALYLMVGVEPPVPLTNDVDITEISNSLQFLKSIVGIK